MTSQGVTSQSAVCTTLGGFASCGCLAGQGHAGTVPMELRKDALAASAECIAGIEQICGGGQYGDGAGLDGLSNPASEVVCTVGSISVWPGASNVIPGNVKFSVDIRYCCCMQVPDKFMPRDVNVASDQGQRGLAGWHVKAQWCQ